MKRIALALSVVILAVIGGLIVRADLERPRPTDAQPSGAATVTTTAIPTAANPVALAVPPGVPADWRLQVVHRVLFAFPPGWGATGVPGGETGRWEVLVAGGEGGEDVMTVALWSGRNLADVAGAVTEGHSVRVTPTRRELSLDGRPAQEITFTELTFPAKGPGGTITYESRHLIVALGEGLVADFRIHSGFYVNATTALTADERERQELVAARAFVLRDADLSLDHDRVRQALARAIPLGAIRNTDSGLTGTDTTSYRSGSDDREFAIVAIYGTRRQRLGIDPNESGGFAATALFMVPVTHRGVGNAFVAVGSNDVNVRYRALRALDELVPAGARPPTTCDDRDAVPSFIRLVRGFGVASYRDSVFRLLTPDASWEFEDPRGTWPNTETLRGPLFANAFFRSPPIVELVTMNDNEVRRSGDRLSTPASATVRRSDRTVVPLFAEARVTCVDGDVRFSQVRWRFG